MNIIVGKFHSESLSRSKVINVQHPDF
jgi:hypothetical protein